MAITFGFYNSVDGDRKYNSIQVSSIFDGIIADGIYETIGECFRVSASNGSEVSIAPGRAWFNRTWTLNDSIYIQNCGQSEVLLDRIDAVVIEVDTRDSVRENAIKVIHGTPSSTPTRPTLSKSGGIYQYALAYIYRKANVDTITTANITNAIGTSETPFVIGVVKTMNIDMFIEQWSAEWNDWIAGKKSDIILDWDTWFNAQKEKIEPELTDWINQNQNAFIDWFNSLQILLDGDVAANLANEITKINTIFDTLAKEQKIYRHILDSDGDPIMDSDGDPLYGNIKFCIPLCGCE